MYFDQTEYDLRCEWGMRGLLALAPVSDAVVIVDVLSFSTAVDIAVSNGASVFPYRWKDDSAARFAREKGALLASDRTAAGQYSLSPDSLRSIPAQTRLVLPSPNGSSLALSANGVPVFTACLRNAPAVAKRVAACGSRIAVIPAGERWEDNTLRAVPRGPDRRRRRPCRTSWNVVAGSRVGGIFVRAFSLDASRCARSLWIGQGTHPPRFRLRCRTRGGVCSESSGACACRRSVYGLRTRSASRCIMLIQMRAITRRSPSGLRPVRLWIAGPGDAH